MSNTNAGLVIDQAYKSSRTKIVVATLNPALPPVVTVLMKQLASQSEFEYQRVSKMEELTEAVSGVPKAIVVATIMEPQDVTTFLVFLKNNETRIFKGGMRIVVVNRMNHPKVLTLLKSRGVSEILEFHVTSKALNLKIKNQTLFLVQAYERALREERSAMNAAASQSAVAGYAGSDAKVKGDGGTQCLWEPADEHRADYWIMTNKRNVRFVMGRWLVEMLGPAPSAGTWESTDLTWRGEIGWQWKLREGASSVFNRTPGTWIFFGRVPEFIWQKHLWSFVGKFPAFAFYANGELATYRFKCESGQTLLMRENSENAKDMMDEVKATLDSSLRLSHEEAVPPPVNVNLNQDPSRGKSPDSVAIVSKAAPARPRKPETVAAKKARREKEAKERADSRALSMVWSTSSAGGPSAAWQNHFETPGVGMGKNGLSQPAETPVSEWGGVNLFKDSPTATALGLMSFSELNLTPNSTVFETLKLEIALRRRRGVALVKPQAVKLLDYLDGEVLLDAEIGACSRGDPLEMSVTLTLGHRESMMELHGEASIVDPETPATEEETRCLVALQLTGEVRTRFESVLNIFQERQLELNHFFRMARGA